MTIPLISEANGTQLLDSLLRPVLPVAYRAAFHLTRDSTEAEDVVQEAALNACRAFFTFEPGTNFRAWFLRIVTNVFLMRCRREKRETGSLPFEDDALHVMEGGHDTTETDPLATTIARMETEEVTAALQELPPEYRAVAVLYFVDDLAYQEIARIVDCPVGTVRSRLHRARRLLKVRLRRIAAERGIGTAQAPSRAPRRRELIRRAVPIAVAVGA